MDQNLYFVQGVGIICNISDSNSLEEKRYMVWGFVTAKSNSEAETKLFRSMEEGFNQYMDRVEELGGGHIDNFGGSPPHKPVDRMKWRAYEAFITGHKITVTKE